MANNPLRGRWDVVNEDTYNTRSRGALATLSVFHAEVGTILHQLATSAPVTNRRHPGLVYSLTWDPSLICSLGPFLTPSFPAQKHSQASIATTTTIDSADTQRIHRCNRCSGSRPASQCHSNCKSHKMWVIFFARILFFFTFICYHMHQRSCLWFYCRRFFHWG